MKEVKASFVSEEVVQMKDWRTTVTEKERGNASLEAGKSKVIVVAGFLWRGRHCLEAL